MFQNISTEIRIFKNESIQNMSLKKTSIKIYLFVADFPKCFNLLEVAGFPH